MIEIISLNETPESQQKKEGGGENNKKNIKTPY